MYPYPAASPAPQRRIVPPWLIAVGAIILVLGLFAGVAALKSRGEDPAAPESAPTAAAPAFDRAGFDAYWQQWASTSWGRHVTRVEPDAYGVTAHTDLYADADAREPAMAICGAVASFWAGKANPPGVRVLDGAEQVLASRHTGEATCSWRR